MSPGLWALGPADDARVELDKLLRTPHKDGARCISFMSQETPSPAGCKLSPQLAAARRPQQSPQVASSPRTRSRRPRTRSRLTASPAAAHNSADRDHRAFSSVLKGTDSECSSLVFIFGVD